MEDRRKWKSMHSKGHKRCKSLNNRLQWVIDKARKKWWYEQCAELEKPERQEKINLLCRKVSQLMHRKRKKQSLCGRDKEGNVLTDSDKVQKTWKEYTNVLNDNNNKPREDLRLETDTEEDVRGPPIFSLNLKQHSAS